MELSRRKFLKLAGAAGAAGAALAPGAARASTAILGGRGRGLLIDTTRCVGCRACEAACSEKNALPEPALAGDDRVFDLRRTTAPHVYTVVNRYANPKDASAARYVKTQCMHCVEPACASACPATALSAVPFILTLWPPVLMGLYAINKRRDAVAREAAGESESHHE